jgi:hypothetical protein
MPRAWPEPTVRPSRKTKHTRSCTRWGEQGKVCGDRRHGPLGRRQARRQRNRTRASCKSVPGSIVGGRSRMEGDVPIDVPRNHRRDRALSGFRTLCTFVCSPLHTSGQNACTGEVACPISQPQERAAAQSNTDYEGHWRYHRAPVGFVHGRERRKSCSDRIPIRARRVRVDRVQVGGGSSGLLVPAMQRDTDLRHDGIEDVDGARITQDGVAYSTGRTHDPLE